MASPYKRVLLKLSGETFLGKRQHGIDPEFTQWLAREIKKAHEDDIQIAIIVGGGNIFRGATAEAHGLERTVGDYIGMLATIMNALALQAALEKEKQQARVLSALDIKDVCEPYIRRRAIRHLEKSRVVIFAGGSGNPYFTTDTAASLRAVEIDADLLIKATKVDGIYSSDPLKDEKAERYSVLGYDEIIERKLGVMDTTAIVLCRDNDMPLRVLNLLKPGSLIRAAKGMDEGTLVIHQSSGRTVD